MKAVKFLGIILTGTLVWAVGVYGGYRLYKPSEEEVIKKPEITIIEPMAKESSNISEDKINDSTKMVYEYCYEGDGYIERVEDTPPYFLIDLDRKSLTEKMNEWQILKFSDSEVVMRKNVSGNGTQNYIISEYEGLVTVFYEQPVDGERIMEITDTPVNSLPQEEQIKIKNGIKIKGQNELIKCMENYES